MKNTHGENVLAENQRQKSSFILHPTTAALGKNKDKTSGLQ